MRAWEIHPAFVHFPIAFLVGGVVLDLFGRSSESAVTTATYLLIAGLATGAIAAAAGVVSYTPCRAITRRWPTSRPSTRTSG